MIKQIQIKNYALIEDSQIELDSKLNVITGETGAGKSLFLSAISLILGEKADTQLIKNKDKETSILIEINPKKIKSLMDFLKENDLGDDSFILKRIFNNSSSRCFINNQPVNLQTVKKLMSNLVFICSQNESVQITDKEKQFSVLDSFTESQHLAKFNQEFSQMNSLIKEKNDLLLNSKKTDGNLDFIEFQIEEITASNVSEKDLNIADKIREIKSKIEVGTIVDKIKPIIKGESSIIGKIRDFEHYYSKLSAKISSLPSLDKIAEAKTIISDFLKDLDLDSLVEDEDDLEYWQKRNESLSKILKKHGPTIQDVLNKKQELLSKKKKAESLEGDILDLDDKIKKSKDLCLKTAKLLSQDRLKKLPFLEKEITKNLQDLNMVGSEFKIQMKDSELSSHGINSIEFLIKPHAGQEPMPISKIASGGELSRILLSINAVIDNEGCFLFDEIDSGIGGNTGIKIGEKLKLMGSKTQIICISHLHQVAVYADKHFRIEKFQEKNKTITQIKHLDSNEIEKEVSRMLGDDLSKNSINHAKELIKNAQKK